MSSPFTLRPAAIALGLATLSVAAGCAGSVKGEIDGDKVGQIDSGFWFYAAEGDDGAVAQVSLATFGGYCDKAVEVVKDATDSYERFFDGDIDQDELGEELADTNADLLPSKYWLFDVAFYAEDEDDFVGDDYDFDAEVPTAAAQVCHQSSALDLVGLFLEGDLTSEDVECFYGRDGDLEITAFGAGGGRVKGRGSVELVDEDGDRAGDVEYTFSVPYCAAYEEALEDFQDLMAENSG